MAVIMDNVVHVYIFIIQYKTHLESIRIGDVIVSVLA